MGYRPEATSEGICVNGANFVRWENIVSAKKISFFGFPYILLTLDGHKPPFYFKKWWVPLYLGGLAKFNSDVEAYCPPNHPVRAALVAQKVPLSPKEYAKTLGLMLLICALVSIFLAAPTGFIRFFDIKEATGSSLLLVLMGLTIGIAALFFGTRYLRSSTDMPKPMLQRKYLNGLFFICAAIFAVVAESYLAVAKGWYQGAALFYSLERSFWITQIVFTLPAILSLIIIFQLLIRSTRIRLVLMILTGIECVALLLSLLSEIGYKHFVFFQLSGVFGALLLLFAIPILRSGAAIKDFPPVRPKELATTALILCLYMGWTVLLPGHLIKTPFMLITKPDSCVSIFGKYLHVPRGCQYLDEFDSPQLRKNRDHMLGGALLCDTMTEPAPLPPTTFMADRCIGKISANDQFEYAKTHLKAAEEMLYQGTGYFCSFEKKSNFTDCQFLSLPDLTYRLSFQGKPQESSLGYYLRSEACLNAIE